MTSPINTSSRKILIVTEYFTPHWTGLAKFSLYLGKELIREGHSVTILTTQFQKKLKQEETIGKIKVLRAPYIAKISRTHYSLAIVWKYLRILGNFETIFVNSPNSNILFFSLMAKLLRKKLIIFHHGDLILPKKTGSRIVNILIERLFDGLTLPSLFMADHIATLTEDYAKHSRVMKHFLHKFSPLIVRFPKTKESPSKTIKETLARLKEKYILIGFAGRFVEEKGFDILLKAIPRVLVRVPNAMFVFSGQTNIHYEHFFDRNASQIRKNKRHLTLLGFLDDKDLMEFFRSLNVFVISSRSDCFPYTQVEAALSGVPIVVTDIPGARVLVRETGFGTIVKLEDPKSLAEGIIEIIRNRKKYLRRKGRITTFLKKYEKFRFDF